MAKKIVRGITDVKTINNQDFDTNNVNDLLSDGQYSYIHRKKGKSEEYHNLTDNIKTISSDNTDLLAVTNNNKTNNTATLHPKHDAQKEQVLQSTRNTVTIDHGTNGTDEKTTVDTNPEKVLEHSNLLTDYGISKNTTGNTTKLGLERTLVHESLDLNNIKNGLVRGINMLNAPSSDVWYLVETFEGQTHAFQKATSYGDGNNTTYIRWRNSSVWCNWREQVGDKAVIDALLSKKQNTITNNTSIGVFGNGLCQLYSYKQTYYHGYGTLKTHVKTVSQNTSVGTLEEEFNFTLKLNQGHQEAAFTLNEHDKTKFRNIITTYGLNDSVRINGCLFTLSNSTLTVITDANTESNSVITFSDII